MADTQEIIKCPACGRNMRKIYMHEQGINLDVCADGCGGIYFDNREFKQFDEKAENIDKIIETLEGKTFIEVDETQTRVCPVCGSNMVKNFSSHRREIEIDECYFCGGKFLDNKELVKFRAEYENEEERSADMIASVYSTVGVEMKKLDERNAYHEMTRSPLSRLFRRLMY